MTSNCFSKSVFSCVNSGEQGDSGPFSLYSSGGLIFEIVSCRGVVLASWWEDDDMCSDRRKSKP